jgi:putative Ca2+/H+ antiporter (TMEM165/GDT1 family)
MGSPLDAVPVVHFRDGVLAELGDKAQLATLLFAADQHVCKLGVFAASSAVLVLSSLLAVLVGGQLSAFVSPRVLNSWRE